MDTEKGIWGEWTPLDAFAMRNFLDYSNGDHVEEWNRQERYYLSAQIGLADGPVNSIYVQRGATDEQIAEQLNMVRRVSGDYQHNDCYGPPCEEQLAYYDKLKRFSTASESEVYLVFHDDCKGIDPPITVTFKAKGLPDNTHSYHDEWNVVANFRERPEHLEVWNRLKVPYAEAAERIRKMEPLPPKVPKPFTIDPIFKQEIDDLIPKLVEIEDEDNAPYKLVVQQKGIRAALEMRFAVLAANKFRVIIGGHRPNYVNAQIGWGEYPYMLTIQLSEYDNWDRWHALFKKHCKIEEWNPREYGKFPAAYWDLSNDPDFDYSKQKVYPIKLEFCASYG